MYYSWFWNNLKDIPFCTLPPPPPPQGWQIFEWGGGGCWRHFFTKAAPFWNLNLSTLSSTLTLFVWVSTYWTKTSISCITGFYLGYLRGRSFPRKMPSFPPKKLILLSLQYSVTISSLQVTEHTVILLKIVSQNAPNCISAHIHFKNFGEGACPWTTQESSWPSATRDFSHKR